MAADMNQLTTDFTNYAAAVDAFAAKVNDAVAAAQKAGADQAAAAIDTLDTQVQAAAAKLATETAAISNAPEPGPGLTAAAATA